MPRVNQNKVTTQKKDSTKNQSSKKQAAKKTAAKKTSSRKTAAKAETAEASQPEKKTSKMELARAVMKKQGPKYWTGDKTRKEIIEQLVTEAGLTPAGAGTYFQKLKWEYTG